MDLWIWILRDLLPLGVLDHLDSSHEKRGVVSAQWMRPAANEARLFFSRDWVLENRHLRGSCYLAQTAPALTWSPEPQIPLEASLPMGKELKLTWCSYYFLVEEALSLYGDASAVRVQTWLLTPTQQMMVESSESFPRSRACVREPQPSFPHLT